MNCLQQASALEAVNWGRVQKDHAEAGHLIHQAEWALGIVSTITLLVSVWVSYALPRQVIKPWPDDGYTEVTPSKADRAINSGLPTANTRAFIRPYPVQMADYFRLRFYLPFGVVSLILPYQQRRDSAGIVAG
jgi:hypothetical protein